MARRRPIDFHSPADHSRAMFVLASAALALSAGLLGWSWKMGQETRALQEKSTRIRAEQAALELELQRQQTYAKGRPPLDESQKARRQMADAPWPELLTAIETVSIPGVRVVSVSVDTAGSLYRLEIEGPSYAELLDYQRQLNEGEPRLRWQWVSGRRDTSSTMNAGAISSVTVTLAGRLQ